MVYEHFGVGTPTWVGAVTTGIFMKDITWEDLSPEEQKQYQLVMGTAIAGGSIVIPGLAGIGPAAGVIGATTPSALMPGGVLGGGIAGIGAGKIAAVGLGVFGTVSMAGWAAKEIFIEPYQFRMSDLIKNDPAMAEANLMQYVNYAVPGYQAFTTPVRAIPVYGQLYEGGAYMDQFWGWVAQLENVQGLSPEFKQFLKQITNEQLLASPLADGVMENVNKGTDPLTTVRQYYEQKLQTQDWGTWSDEEKESFYSYLYASGNAYDEKNKIKAPGVDLAFAMYNAWIKDLGNMALGSDDVFFMMDPIRRKAQDLATSNMYYATEEDISNLLAYKQYLTESLDEYGTVLDTSQKEQISALLRTIDDSLNEWSSEKRVDLKTIQFTPINVISLSELDSQKKANIQSISQIAAGVPYTQVSSDRHNILGQTIPPSIRGTLSPEEVRPPLGRALTGEAAEREAAMRTEAAETMRGAEGIRGVGFVGGPTEVEKAAMAGVRTDGREAFQATEDEYKKMGYSNNEANWLARLASGNWTLDELKMMNPDVYKSLLEKGAIDEKGISATIPTIDSLIPTIDSLEPETGIEAAMKRATERQQASITAAAAREPRGGRIGADVGPPREPVSRDRAMLIMAQMGIPEGTTPDELNFMFDAIMQDLTGGEIVASGALSQEAQDTLMEYLGLHPIEFEGAPAGYAGGRPREMYSRGEKRTDWYKKLMGGG